MGTISESDGKEHVRCVQRQNLNQRVSSQCGWQMFNASRNCRAIKVVICSRKGNVVQIICTRNASVTFMLHCFTETIYQLLEISLYCNQTIPKRTKSAVFRYSQIPDSSAVRRVVLYYVTVKALLLLESLCR
jgi:hypothetical protein